MSVYLGTSIPSSAVKNILHGNFLTPDQQHLILVRPNQLDIYEYLDGSIRRLHTISAKAKIVASVKVKINPTDVSFLY